jgi:hypothetical protein
MDLVNETPLPVALVPNAEQDRVVSLLVLAATYRVGEDGLELAEEQRPLLLLPPPPEVGDGYITKWGASVCATGFVYAQDGLAPRATARLRVGAEERAIEAFGPRVWREGVGGALAATAPLPFDRIAMSWDNAFGGGVWRATRVYKLKGGEEAIAPEHEEAWPANFEGVGYYPERADAVEKPLPNLEDPEHLTVRWDDRPEPVCFAPYPMHGGLRAKAALKDDRVDYAEHGRVVSRAAPRTTFAEIPAGTRVEVEGMRPKGEVLAFDVPPPPVFADVQAGRRGARLVLATDAIDLDAEARTVRIAWRAVFAYELVQYERRRATVRATPAFDEMVLGRARRATGPAEG